MKKRMLSILLTVCMLISLAPATNAAAATDVKYLDEDGKEQSCTTYTEVTDSTDAVAWTDGWYVVKGDNISISNTVTVSGDVHLILVDGAKLTVKPTTAGANGISVASGKTFTVYGQTNHSGALDVTGGNGANDTNGSSGIYARGMLTVNGGTLKATGGKGGNASSRTAVAGNGGHGIMMQGEIGYVINRESADSHFPACIYRPYE